MPDAEEERYETPELRDYLRVLGERWWVVVLSVVVVVLITLLVSLMATPQYKAVASLVYQRNTLDRALFGAQVFENVNQARDVETGAALVKLDSVAAGVKEQTGSTLSDQELLDMVNVKPEGSTDVVHIEAVSPDPIEAAAVANAFAEQFISFRQTNDRATVAAARELVKEQLDSLSSEDAASDYGLMLKEKYETLRILESMQNGGFILVQRAAPPPEPFSPQPVRNGILALVVGLVLGIGLAFLLDYLDKRIKDEKTLEREFGLPVLASVPAVGGKWVANGRGPRSNEPVGFKGDSAVLLESFRTLRSSLQYFDVDSSLRTILITSGVPQEGKTITTVNLAFSLALSGKRVIVLEADLRRPMVHRYLGIENAMGLSSVLAGARSITEALQLVRMDDFAYHEQLADEDELDAVSMRRNLYCLPSGPLPPNPAELLGSTKMAQLIDHLEEMADYLLIDTPPLLPVSDALTLAKHVDAVILAARLNSTTKEDAQEVRDLLGRTGVRVIGVVAGGVKKSRGYYRKRGYSHGYGY